MFASSTSIQQADQFMETFNLEKFLHNIIFSDNNIFHYETILKVIIFSELITPREASFPGHAIFRKLLISKHILY
jgi:hypothetical protein